MMRLFTCRGPVWRCADRGPERICALKAPPLQLGFPGTVSMTICPHIPFDLLPKPAASQLRRLWGVRRSSKNSSIGHQRPRNARHLVGQGDGHQHAWFVLKHVAEPGAGRRSPPDRPSNHCARADNQQTTQISLSHLGCPAEKRLTCRRMLLWQEARPRREIASVSGKCSHACAKASKAVAHAPTDAWNGHQPVGSLLLWFPHRHLGTSMPSAWRPPHRIHRNRVRLHDPFGLTPILPRRVDRGGCINALGGEEEQKCP